MVLEVTFLHHKLTKIDSFRQVTSDFINVAVVVGSTNYKFIDEICLMSNELVSSLKQLY